MDNVLNVYVSPLEMDNPKDRLIDLPMAQPDLEALLQDLGTDLPLYVEVSDYCGRDYLIDHLPEDLDLEELNLLAQKLSAFDPIQEVGFQGLIRMDLGKGLSELPLSRLIDLANSVDCCHVVPSATNDNQLGHFYVDNDFPVIPSGLPEEVYPLLDYEAIGRKARTEEGGVFTPCGYVIQHSDLDISYSQSRGGLELEASL